MNAQIIAIPDKDGIIRVACGEDTIEIRVVPPSGDGDDRGIGRHDFYGAGRAYGGGHGYGGGYDGIGRSPRKGPRDPFGDPYAFAGPGSQSSSSSGNPKFYNTGVYHYHPNAEQVGIDPDTVISSMNSWRMTKENSSPIGVVVHSGGAINVHSIYDLSSRLNDTLPGTGLAVDFNSDYEDV